MPARILVVGSLNMDLVVRAPRIPQRGETIIGHTFHTLPGGKGANQAVAAARLGGSVTLTGRVGRDGFGTTLKANLAASAVAHEYVWVDAEAATGVALITVDDDGENTIVVAPGANGRLTPADVESAARTLTAGDTLLLQLEIPLETVTRAAQLGRARGATVILNPAPAQPLPAELLAQVAILVPNETEAALLSGLPISNPAEAAVAAARLQTAGIGIVIVTLGEQGALVADPNGSRHTAPFRVQTVDTTAAGDAFVGALAVALGEGKPLPQAVRWASAAGALATTRLGAQPSLPSRAQVEALLADSSA